MKKIKFKFDVFCSKQIKTMYYLDITNIIHVYRTVNITDPLSTTPICRRFYMEMYSFLEPFVYFLLSISCDKFGVDHIDRLLKRNLIGMKDKVDRRVEE